MLDLLILLLPVAAASGWWVARRIAVNGPEVRRDRDPEYFQGLNYLIDEQPDKAIDVFVRLLAVDRETAETHLALGSLFRRRGEVERAIRIHQNLIARPKLNREQLARALLELGQDYLRAGLFDRAESLFRELLEMRLFQERALSLLKEIYQQEKDWVECLEVARRLEKVSGRSLQNEMAHFYCELAEEDLGGGDPDAAWSHVKMAFAADRNSVRAALLQARMEVARKDDEAALRSYQRAQRLGPEYLDLVLPDLSDCYRRLDRRREMTGYLEALHRESEAPGVMLALAEAIQQDRGDAAAARLIVDYLRSHADPRALERLLDLREGKADGSECREILPIVRRIVRCLLDKQPRYKCGRCGFVAKQHHWQCPGCSSWGSIKPVPLGAGPAG